MILFPDQYLTNIYQFNNSQREKLLQEALKFEAPEDQLKFVALYMTNALPIEVVAKIDGVEPKKVMPFMYDYSFLEDVRSEDNRRRASRPFCNYSGFSTSLNQADSMGFGRKQVRIFPAVYAIKMGTCVMFANEIKRFAQEFGLECDIVETLDLCYDNFKGNTTYHKNVSIDRLVTMHHYYNVVTINGERYKIDISGFLTAQDFNKNHPETAIKCEDFFFSKYLSYNPFADANIRLNAAQPNDN